MPQFQSKCICINLNRVDDSFYFIKENGKDQKLVYKFNVFNNSKNNSFNTDTFVLLLKEDIIQRDLRFIGNGIVRDYELIQYNIKSDQYLNEFQRFFTTQSNFPTKRYLHRFVVEYEELNSEDKDDYLLSTFAYSIPALAHYSNPSTFFGKYKNIDPEDFLNIISKNIFVSRTIFAKIINALPFENKIELSILLRQKFKSEYRFIPDYKEALNMLYEFINEDLYSNGRLIVSAYDTIEKLDIINLRLKDIGFANEEELNAEYQRFDNLKNQYNRFKELFEFDEKNDFWNKIFDKIKNNSTSESNYNYRFRNIRWPINNL